MTMNKAFRFFSDSNQQLFEMFLDDGGLGFVRDGYVVILDEESDEATNYAEELGGLPAD
jgi:hypothetical protein